MREPSRKRGFGEPRQVTWAHRANRAPERITIRSPSQRFQHPNKTPENPALSSWRLTALWVVQAVTTSIQTYNRGVKRREDGKKREPIDEEIERRIDAARKALPASQETPGAIEFSADRMRRLLRRVFDETGTLPAAAPDDELVAAGRRLEEALDLFDAAVLMTRERLRREQPHASEAEIGLLVSAWVQEHPGAEDGDADGRPVSEERRRRILRE